MTDVPTIALVATGGTIANTGDARVGIETVLDDIKRGGHNLPAAHLQVIDVLRESAATLTPAKWRSIHAAVTDAASAPDVDGVVVSHGTFTAEETAYVLHLSVPSTKPLVVTCAQRLHGSLGNDGDQSLVDAIRVASDNAAAGVGCLLVFNEEVHCARDVVKTSTRLSGFSSRSTGILGTVDLDQVTIYRRPTRRHTDESEFASARLPELPRVDIVETYPGADGAAIDALVAAGARGLVVNGFAFSGRPFDDQLESLHRAVDEGVVVVKVSRGGDGRIPFERDERWIRGDNLSAQKARVLLMLALASAVPPAEMQRVFDLY